VLGTLRSAGLPVADLVAVGVAGSQGVLVTGALPVRANLEQVLVRSSPPLSPATSRRYLVRLIDLVRRLHAAGVQHRDCYLVHVLVGADDALYLVDFGRARLLGRLGLLARVKDLAGLDFSTPDRLASPPLRLALLRRYLGAPSRSWLRFVARLVRWKSGRIRRHVTRAIARGESNVHLTT
jgi:lipopolysaccharide core heptose(I) kinase